MVFSLLLMEMFVWLYLYIKASNRDNAEAIATMASHLLAVFIQRLPPEIVAGS